MPNGVLESGICKLDSKQDRDIHLPVGSIILNRDICIKFTGQERWANDGW